MFSLKFYISECYIKHYLQSISCFRKDLIPPLFCQTNVTQTTSGFKGCEMFQMSSKMYISIH